MTWFSFSCYLIITSGGSWGTEWQCKVCMQTFMCTTSEVKCREHAEAKHPKFDLYACFPHLKKWRWDFRTGTSRLILLGRCIINYADVCYSLACFTFTQIYIYIYAVEKWLYQGKVYIDWRELSVLVMMLILYRFMWLNLQSGVIFWWFA